MGKRLIEVWKPVPGFEKDYEVSNLGRIRSWRVKGSYKTRSPEPILMKPYLSGQGYYQVEFKYGRNRNHLRVNRIVLSAFVGSPSFEGAVAAHLNGNKLDNNLTNLAWKTHQENMEDRTLHNPPARTRECCIEGCNKPGHCRDMCKRHYQRWWERGRSA